MYIEKIKNEHYHVKREGHQIGAFKIIERPGGVGQIKQLEVSNTVVPGDILHIFELIQVYAGKENFSELHVESHSVSLDHILHHQQFQLADGKKRLWTYKVINR